MKYRLVIFDFDGTLADSYPWFTSVLDRVSEKFGFRTLRSDELRELGDFDIRNIMRSLGLPLRRLPSMLKYVRSLMSEEADAVPLFPGAEYLIRELSGSGVTLAIASSNSEENAACILGYGNIKVFSIHEFGISLLGKHSKLKKIIKKSRMHKDQALYIGDEIRDLEAAGKTGIAFGAVSWGYNSIDSLKAHEPDELFYTIEEIRKVILSI